MEKLRVSGEIVRTNEKRITKMFQNYSKHLLNQGKIFVAKSKSSGIFFKPYLYLARGLKLGLVKLGKDRRAHISQIAKLNNCPKMMQLDYMLKLGLITIIT